MPKVPMIDFPRRQYPNIPFDLYKGEGAELGFVGKTVQDIGEAIQSFLDKNRQNRNRVGIIKAKNYIRSREIELANQIRNDSNYFLYQENLAKFHQDTVKGVYNLLGKVSPELGTAISGELIQSYNQQSYMLAEKENQMAGSESVAEFEKATLMNVSYAANSDDPKYVESVRKEVENDGQSLVDVNYLSPVKLARYMEEFDKNIKKERANIADDKARKLSYDDPEGFLEKAVDPNFLPDLDPGRRVIHQEAAEVRIRVRENQRAKEVNKLQNKKRAEISLLYGRGRLTIQDLADAMQIDPNTGEPGIDSPFYLNMLERLKSGKDQITDMDVFYKLYQNPKLKYENIAPYLDKLSPRHEQMLMAIAQRNVQKELTAAEKEEKKAKDDAIKIRTRWANQARRGLWKAITAMELSQEEAFEAIELFELTVDDETIPAEELPKKTEKILEQYKGWFAKWWSSLWSSEPESKAVKPKAPEIPPKAPSKLSPAPVPVTPGQKKGKPPLEFMKGVLPPKEKKE